MKKEKLNLEKPKRKIGLKIEKIKRNLKSLETDLGKYKYIQSLSEREGDLNEEAKNFIYQKKLDMNLSFDQPDWDEVAILVEDKIATKDAYEQAFNVAIKRKRSHIAKRYAKKLGVEFKEDLLEKTLNWEYWGEALKLSEELDVDQEVLFKILDGLCESSWRGGYTWRKKEAEELAEKLGTTGKEKLFNTYIKRYFSTKNFPLEDDLNHIKKLAEQVEGGIDRMINACLAYQPVTAERLSREYGKRKKYLNKLLDSYISKDIKEERKGSKSLKIAEEIGKKGKEKLLDAQINMGKFPHFCEKLARDLEKKDLIPKILEMYVKIALSSGRKKFIDQSKRLAKEIGPKAKEKIISMYIEKKQWQDAKKLAEELGIKKGENLALIYEHTGDIERAVELRQNI